MVPPQTLVHVIYRALYNTSKMTQSCIYYRCCTSLHWQVQTSRVHSTSLTSALGSQFCQTFLFLWLSPPPVSSWLKKVQMPQILLPCLVTARYYLIKGQNRCRLPWNSYKCFGHPTQMAIKLYHYQWWWTATAMGCYHAHHILATYMYTVCMCQLSTEAFISDSFSNDVLTMGLSWDTQPYPQCV